MPESSSFPSSSHLDAGFSSTKQGSPIPIIFLKTLSTPKDAYLVYFTSESFCPRFLPVLQHSFVLPALTELRTLLESPKPHSFSSRYGGIICTSQRAVEALAFVLQGIADDDGNQNDVNNIPQIILGASEEESKERSQDAVRKAEVIRANSSKTQAIKENNSEAVDRLRQLQLPLYTVGPATSRALSALAADYLPHCPVLGQETGNGANLAEYILQHYSFPNSDVTNGPNEGAIAQNESPQRLPLLFLVGETRRDIIPLRLNDSDLPKRQRVRVDELVVYASEVLPGFSSALHRFLGDFIPALDVGPKSIGENEAESNIEGLGVGQSEHTIITNEMARTSLETQRKNDLVPQEPQKHIAAHISDHTSVGSRILWFVVFSPAGMKELVKAIQNIRNQNLDSLRVYVASIGPTTRDILASEHNFKVDVCAVKPSPEGLGEGIAAFLHEQATA